MINNEYRCVPPWYHVCNELQWALIIKKAINHIIFGSENVKPFFIVIHTMTAELHADQTLLCTRFLEKNKEKMLTFRNIW